MKRTYKLAFFSLAVNISFGVYNVIIGAVTRSWWLLTLGAYYTVLSIVRYKVLRFKKEKDIIIKKFAGIMLIIMSFTLVGTIILATVRDRGIIYHQIIMITIAVYTFAKIVLASINLAKSKHKASAKIQTLRNISFADAFVSIFSLQRSMLVSFGKMDEDVIKLMNVATGCAVCITVFSLGINLLRKNK